MRIGEVADKVGVNTKTIRYYEGIGLLPDPERLPSGYRTYSDDDVGRLSFIRTAQRLGLALSEISEILAFRDREERPCVYVLGVLDRQVADLDRRMAEMAQVRHDLIALKKKAERLPPDEGCYCSVIEHAPAGAGNDDDEPGRRARIGRFSTTGAAARGNLLRQRAPARRGES